MEKNVQAIIDNKVIKTTAKELGEFSKGAKVSTVIAAATVAIICPKCGAKGEQFYN